MATTNDNSNPCPTGRGEIFTAALLFVVALLILFWRPLFSGLPLWGPDNLPLYPGDYPHYLRMAWTGQWSAAMLGRNMGVVPFHPLRAFALVLPPFAYHLFGYMAGVVLMGLATAYYLKGRGLRGPAVWLPAMAFAFIGYFFTLISAGHRGMFEGVPFAILMFGCLDRAIVRRSLVHYAAAGVCAAFALPQPDVAALFLILATVYGLFRVVQTNKKKWTLPLWRHLLIGGVLGALFFVTVAAAPISQFIRQQLPGRQEQLESDGQRDPWIFATNWSLPPEDMLEFVVPFVFGRDTNHPDAPYWGRLGQSFGWRRPGDGLTNLRQHTVYMGVVQVFFAFYALAFAFRRTKTADSNEARELCPIEPDRRTDTRFWAAVAAIACLLALGRYTPLYRLFFSIPYVSLLRAPVKFLHVAGFALCNLFALGLQIFLVQLSPDPTETSLPTDRASRKALKRKRANDAADRIVLPGFRLASYAGLSLGMALLLIAVGLPAVRGLLATRWNRLFSGMVPAEHLALLHDVLLKNMRGAFIHSAVLFFALSAIFFLARRFRSHYRLVLMLPYALALLVVADSVRVAKPFVRTADVGTYYAPNPVAEAIHSEPGSGRTSYWLPPRGHTDWPRLNLESYHGVEILEPNQDTNPGEAYTRFSGALRRHHLRLYQLTSVRAAILPQEGAASLAEHPAFEPLLHFKMEGQRFVRSRPDEASGTVFRFKAALPRALVYHRWIVEPDEDKLLHALAAAEWNPWQSAYVFEAPAAAEPVAAAPVSEARIVRYERNRIVIETETDAPGLLLLNDRYDPEWTVRVDGKAQELIRANFLMRGVWLPAGRHEIVFRFKPYQGPFIASFLALLALALWIGLAIGMNRTPERKPGNSD